MQKGILSEYFVGVTAKRLSAVEINPDKSNQHEINGVNPLKKLIGEERLTDRSARFVWLGQKNEGVSEDSFVTWYDSREGHPTRTEYRLYFRSNPVMEVASEGDLLIVARRPSGELMIIVCAKESTVENQLLWLFGVPVQIGTSFEYRDFDHNGDMQVDFAVRYILEALEIETEEPEAEKLDALLERFQGDWPTTAIFSAFARETSLDVSSRDDPDAALLT